RLEEAGETLVLRQRHRDWCLDMVEGSRPEAFDLPRVTRLLPELDNLRAALGWTMETRQVTPAARLALGMSAVWHMQGSFSEGRAALTAVLDLALDGDATPELAHVSTWASIMAVNQGDYVAAQTLIQTAVQLARASGDAYAELFAVNQQGWVALVRGESALARAIFERTYRIVADTSQPLHILAWTQLALACIEEGDRERAFDLLYNPSAAVRSSMTEMFRGRQLHARALLSEQAGDFAAADRLF